MTIAKSGAQLSYIRLLLTLLSLKITTEMASESTPSPSDSKARPIALTISFRGALYTITLPSSSPLSVLHARLEEFSAVPSPLQKLLYKGKKLTWSSEEAAQSTTVEDAGLKDGMKAQLLGSTLKEVEVLKKEEGEYMRKERIMKERALKAPVKVGTISCTT